MLTLVERGQEVLEWGPQPVYIYFRYYFEP